MTKKQALIVFLIISTIGVVVVALVLTLGNRNEEQSSPQQEVTTSPQSVIDKLQDDFEETSQEVSGEEELEFDVFENIEGLQQDEITGEVVPTEGFNIDAAYESLPGQYDVFKGDARALYLTVPNSQGLYDEYLTGELSGGRKLYTFTTSTLPEFKTIPVLKNDSSQTDFNVMVLQDGDDYMLLGEDILSIHEFTVNGTPLWASLLINETGFQALYLSKPFFKELQFIPDIYFAVQEPSDVYKNGNFLIAKSLFEGGDEFESTYSINIEQVAKAAPGADYRQFITVLED